MFERLRKVFGQDKSPGSVPASEFAASAVAGAEGAPSDVARWAGAMGYVASGAALGRGFAVKGDVAGKPWKMELGRSSRDYIHGDELRARGEMQANEEAAVLIMSRPLKDALEKRAYQMYTDTLQTTADPSLPEEMRWLAMYPECGWDGLPAAFWDRYSVMADHRSHGMAWITPSLADLLLGLPAPEGSDIPFILMMLRGKAYLRMQYTPAGMPTLEHATSIFTCACESAVANLSTDITL